MEYMWHLQYDWDKHEPGRATIWKWTLCSARKELIFAIYGPGPRYIPNGREPRREQEGIQALLQSVRAEYESLIIIIIAN